MRFNDHSALEGQHAFLGASKYHWINYDEDKLDYAFSKFLAAERGTRLHAFACESIRLGIKLPKTKNTLNLYVNDAIGFKMATEQMFFYSYNSFGTADATSFRQDMLRIHDLKTGDSPCSFHQLEVLDALFCLEYHYKPADIGHEHRIYQADEVLVSEPPAEAIEVIMNKIVTFDKRIETLKIGE